MSVTLRMPERLGFWTLLIAKQRYGTSPTPYAQLRMRIRTLNEQEGSKEASAYYCIDKGYCRGPGILQFFR